MMNEISYRKKNDDIECVHYKNWTKAYPPHTHAEHLTLGIVEAGKVCIVINGISKIFCEGDEFQIQCKVRKAQKLLEEEKSVCEVTYDAGFCDQSHLDRCFQKLVGMTPKKYKEAASPKADDEPATPSTKPGKTSQKDKDLPDQH